MFCNNKSSYDLILQIFMFSDDYGEIWTERSYVDDIKLKIYETANDFFFNIKL